MARIAEHPVLPPPTERREVFFTFDGQPLRGFAGEMIASALLAAGVDTFSHHPRGDAPQGIFCANGQCAKCTVLVDGYPVKSCIHPLSAGMDIRSLRGLPALPADDRPLGAHERRERACDVLVVGGGPSGLTATVELARLGLDVLLVDDKDRLGGKLLLQTHKFFGSIADCHAGTRGVDIAAELEREVRALPNVEVLTGATAVGVYKDRKVGLFLGGSHYELVSFQGLVVSAGAREKSLVFPGNDLPGVYGAGAFQTLVNRDLVRPADRVLIVGSGNVGLIAAYHALQADIGVVGIVDVADRVGGYKVHADKIRRMGVPIHLGHTVIAAEGAGRVERVTVAAVDADWRPLLQTARTHAVDTVLVAAGLSPVDEFFDAAARFGFPVVKAGDADEIAEASSAMFGGRLAGRQMARELGHEVALDASYREKAALLQSRPGAVHDRREPVLTDEFRPILHCIEEIPCDPCTTVCKQQALRLEARHGNLMDVPVFDGHCNGCTACVTICPGLAITLARRLDDRGAEVVLPHEFTPRFGVGDHVAVMAQEGEFLAEAEVVRVRLVRKRRTHLVTVRVALAHATRVAGIRVQDPAVSEPLPEPSLEYAPEAGIVCRCERVTLGEVVEHIRVHQVTDANQLKQIRVGMGACCGKTCPQLLPLAFRRAGVDWSEVTPQTRRPLCVEVPMAALLNEEPA